MKTKRWMVRSAAPMLLLLVIGCQSTGVPPTQIAADVAALLVAGDTARAEARFEEIGGDDDRALAYPVLHGQAETLWQQRDYASCIRVNRFLVAHYPDRVSAREALLYALFLNRARTGKVPGEATRREMAELGTAIRRVSKEPPLWVDLALVQVAIDGGDQRIARASMARFRSRWNGRPASLRDYAQELDRWLLTHEEPQAGPTTR